MSISIQDVALSAGVSKSTVSQVLNGNERIHISASTQERVRRIARELGYRPNKMARSLGGGKTETIGLVFPGFSNPFFVTLFETVEQLVHEAGYSIQIDTTPSFIEAEHGKLSGWSVDGLLLWATHAQSLAHYLGPQSKGAPVIYMGDTHPRPGDDVVGADVEEGAQTLMRYVLSQGYTRIAFVAPPYIMERPQEARFRTYRAMCGEAGLTLETIALSREEETRSVGRDLGLQLATWPAAQRPQILMCLNDVIALGVVHGLRRGGLRVPEDISVTGFDGIDEGQTLDRPLTTVRAPVESLCRRAVDTLLQRINGEGTKPQNVVFPHSLIEGETVAAMKSPEPRFEYSNGNSKEVPLSLKAIC